jgi:hypothetical protein
MKTCANPACGRPLAQKPSERDSNFARRVTCGNACAIALRRSKGAACFGVLARSSGGAEWEAGYRPFRA